jgi:hypothetical protein
MLFSGRLFLESIRAAEIATLSARNPEKHAHRPPITGQRLRQIPLREPPFMRLFAGISERRPETVGPYTGAFPEATLEPPSGQGIAGPRTGETPNSSVQSFGEVHDFLTLTGTQKSRKKIVAGEALSGRLRTRPSSTRRLPDNPLFLLIKFCSTEGRRIPREGGFGGPRCQARKTDPGRFFSSFHAPPKRKSPAVRTAGLLRIAT